LIRLGFGRAREGEADARAHLVVRELGYDPDAPSRYLRRLSVRAERGDPAVADLCVAHPPPGYRVRQLDGTVRFPPANLGVRRVNREVFRRGLGELSLGTVRPAEPAWRPPRNEAQDRARLTRALWYGGAIAAVAAVVVALGLVLLG
jgi:predicted Zn-dependent protease